MPPAEWLRSIPIGCGEQIGDVRIVILSARRMPSPAQVVMNLNDWNAFMRSRTCPVIISIERFRFDMGDHLHRMTSKLRAPRQTARVHFGAADTARKVLMGEISDLQWFLLSQLPSDCAVSCCVFLISLESLMQCTQAGAAKKRKRYTKTVQDHCLDEFEP